MWAPQPTRSTQTLAMLRSGSMPRRPEWGVRTHTAHLSRIPWLEHNCPQQAHPWAIIITGEPLQCGVESWDAHHPGPPIASMPQSSMHPTMEHPSKTATSITAELQELLSQAVPDTSDLVPGHTAPRRSLSVTQGSWLLIEEGSQQSESTDSGTPASAVTLMCSNNSCVSTITLASPVFPAPKTIQVTSVSPVCQPKISLA